MLAYFILLRLVMLPACIGAFLAAILMFALAALKLAGANSLLWTDGSIQAARIIAAVMGATDALLFGVVLVVIAYAIAFGFLLPDTETVRQHTPDWMRFHGLSQIKHTLIELVIVYLVVDFATDLTTADAELAWTSLVKPAAIALIGVTLRLLAPPEAGDRANGGVDSSRTHETK